MATVNPDALARAAGSIGLKSWHYFGRGRSLHVGSAETDTMPVIAAVYSPPFLESNDPELRTPAVATALEAVHEDIGRLLTALFWVQASGASLLASATVGRQSTVRDEAGRYWIVQPLAGAVPLPLRPLLIGAQSTERWPDDRLRAFAAMLAAGLAPIHKIGRTHLNIGPATVAQRADGRCGVLAPLPHERGVIAALGRNDRIGLDAWSSPELFDGSGSLPVGAPSDIYSASALMFRLAAGTVPPAWQERLSEADRVATLLADLAPQCSIPLRDAIAAGLIIDPRQRPVSVGAWLSLMGRSDPPGDADLTMAMWTGVSIVDSAAVDAVRLAAEKAEAAQQAEQQAAEAAAEEARREEVRAETARVAAEQAEFARLDQLREVAEQAAAAKALAERIEAERLAAEAERAEAERLEAERRETGRLEAERAEAGRIEAERAAAEQAIAEAARIEVERLASEKAQAKHLAAEEAEAARVQAARMEAERREAKRVEAVRVEAERAEAERAEAERVEAERIEAERAEAERIEAERVEAERVEAERIEAGRRAAEQADTALVDDGRVDLEGGRADEKADPVLALSVAVDPSPHRPPWMSILGAIGLLAATAAFMVWANSDGTTEAVSDAQQPRDEAAAVVADVAAAPPAPSGQLVNLGGRDIDVQPWLGSYFYGDDTGCTSPLTVALQRDGQAVTGLIITGLDGTTYTTAWNSTGEVGGDGRRAATLPTVVTGVTPGEAGDAAAAEELTGILLVLADVPSDSGIALRWGGEVAGEERYRRCRP